MNLSTQFCVACPGCRRKRQLSIQYLGRQIQCRFCRISFSALAPDHFSQGQQDPIQYCLKYCANDPDQPAPESYKPK